MNRPLFVLSLAIFASMLGNGVVMPFLPLYAQQFAASGAAVGMLFGAHSAARTLLLPVIGRTSDRHGRKAFLLGGMLLYTVTAIAYLLTNSLLTLVIVMAVQGIATAMIQPTSLAYVGDLTPKGKEGTYAGYANTAFLGGVAGGPVLGGVIKDLFSMQMSFIVLGVLSLLSFVLLLAFLPDSRYRKATAKAGTLPWRALVASRPILGVTFFRLVYSLSNVMVWIFVPLLAAHLLSLNTTQVGLLISLNVLVSTLLQFPCGRLADRMSKALLIGIGGGVSALALAAFPFASSFWHLLALNLLVGVGFGFAYPAHMALAMEHAPGPNMGTVMSMLLTVHSFAMTVAPPLFGILVDRYTLGSAFYCAGFLSVVALLICYALVSTTQGASPARPLAEGEQTVTD
jgi:MFS family permease